MWFKGFSTILVMCGVVFSASVTKEYAISTPKLMDGKLMFEGGRIGQSIYGPSVAVQPVKLLLPRGHRVKQARVSYDGLTELSGSFYVKPYAPMYNQTIGPPAHPLLKASKAYGVDEYFPARATTPVVRTMYKNGHAIAVGVVQPVQYNPVTRKGRFFSRVRITLETEPNGSAPVVKTSPAIISKLEAIVDNPKALRVLAKNSAASNRQQVGADDFEYLIICTDVLAGGFNEFIAFNKRRGMRTQVMTMTQTQQFGGRDQAEKVRNAIKDKYEKNNIRYVLLAGDDDNLNPNDIPHRGMHVVMYDHHVTPDRRKEDFDIPADLYYSTLDGDWLTDNTTGVANAYFGEYGTEDWFADVYASRFAVDDIAELNNIIQKTIAYSESPVANQVKNTLFAGEKLWDGPDGVTVWGIGHMESHIGLCNDFGITTYGIPDDWNIAKLMERGQGEYEWADVMQSIADNKTAWMNHMGHANTRWCMKISAEAIDGNTFSVVDGQNINHFLYTSAGCYAGAFDNKSTRGQYGDDCWSEVVHHQPNGPVAVLSNTRFGYGDDDGNNGPSQRPVRWFHDAIFNPEKRIHHLQEMLSYAAEIDADLLSNADFVTDPPYYGNIKWCIFQFNSLGDPALSVWTDTPKEMSPAITLSEGGFSLDPNPGPYTSIALADPEGNIICAQQTGNEAAALIQNDVLSNYIGANPGGTMKVFIKAHNYLPYEGTATIANTDVPMTGLSGEVSFRTQMNPISRRLTVSYNLPHQSYINLSLYNSRGALIKSLVKGTQPAEKHEHSFNLAALERGIYYCKLRAGDTQGVNKLVVTR